MKTTKNEAITKSKFGINLWVYKTNTKEAGFVYTEVAEGHFEEFYHKVSTFIYYVLEGEGKFFLDGVETPVKATDLIVIPPNTKIYYLGNMKLNLITVPAWSPENEVHVRDISVTL
ncbi:MAG: cupin domain-containing protein [Patescibacteria group bacterium]